MEPDEPVEPLEQQTIPVDAQRFAREGRPAEVVGLEAETQLSDEKTGSPAPVRSGKTVGPRATS